MALALKLLALPCALNEVRAQTVGRIQLRCGAGSFCPTGMKGLHNTFFQGTPDQGLAGTATCLLP